MAGDWVKMRTDLYRDPKVSLITDALFDEDGMLAEYINQNCQRDMTVTRNVMRNVTVGALVSVWGVCRHRGKRVEYDLVLSNTDISAIDDIADLDGFGSAMAVAGWVIQNGKDLIFPRFFEDWNVDPAEELRNKNAERQRRYRLNRNVTRDVTVAQQSNAREEESREENKEEASLQPPKKRRQATQLPDIPESLDTPEFRDAWADWQIHRAEIKKKLTPMAVKQQFAELAAMGPVRAVACVRHSIAKGWTGLFEPKVIQTRASPSEPSGRVVPDYEQTRRDAEEFRRGR